MTGKSIVSTSELADVLGLTPRRIRQLATSGVVNRVSRGKYALSESVQGYIEWVKEQAAGDIDLKKEQALLTRVRREKVELELQVRRGELHHSNAVRKVMNDMINAFRTRCLSIPSKVAPRLESINDAAIIRDVLKKEIYEALSELSEYSPEFFHTESNGYLIRDMSEKEETRPEKGQQNARTEDS